ncbi:protein FAM210B, mitochondrial-like [Diorhabda carinulata]|uniref:protein FAM210B, mitochondrial-like n=1 Tax=Diorhabda carinulata TaxID=1163345 RepID=UPI0025A28F9F|nr:protein FAM210B, mitochondrial-like [Diorhabda carinulata]
MGRANYTQIINVIRKSTINLGNCSVYRSYCHSLTPLSRTSVVNSFIVPSIMNQNILSRQTFRLNSTEFKEAKEDSGTSVKQAPDKIVITESLSRKEKLKKAVKEYGSTVIIFHVGISLISLGTSYALVSIGLDVMSLFESIGLKDWFSNSNIATNAGTFAVAYAIHKVFAPIRITITLAAVPFIVRYLRRIGFLKK